MKGGFNNPPNRGDDDALGVRMHASMKGGFNNPPNSRPLEVSIRKTMLQ